MDLLFLVVNGDFTPLLSCNASLDLEVLQFMNLDIIEVPQTNANEKQMQKDKLIKSELFDNDSVLSKYRDCFSLKPGTLPTNFIWK